MLVCKITAHFHLTKSKLLASVLEL